MEKKNDKNEKPTLEYKSRMGGQTRTVLLRPLKSTVDESDISLFVKQASLSAPLRVDLFCHRYGNDDSSNSSNDNKSNDEYCGYAYVTFPSHDDCELVVHRLNGKKMDENCLPVRVE